MTMPHGSRRWASSPSGIWAAGDAPVIADLIRNLRSEFIDRQRSRPRAGMTNTFLSPGRSRGLVLFDEGGDQIQLLRHIERRRVTAAGHFDNSREPACTRTALHHLPGRIAQYQIRFTAAQAQ